MKILAFLKREWQAYFSSGAAYIFLIAFWLGSGIYFFRSFFLAAEASLRIFLDAAPYLLLFLCPAIGMRMWAEEKKSETLPFLLTLPVRVWQIAAGKFLAACALLLLALFGTAPLAIVVAHFGLPDWGAVFCGYLGVFLLGACFLSVSFLASSLSRSQVVAFICAAAACFMLHVISLGNYFESVSRGVIDLRDLVFFFSVILFFLFLTIFVIDPRRFSPRNNLLGATFLVILLAANAALLPLTVRLDMTRYKVFSLSLYTQQLLKNLDTPVYVRFYVSNNLPPQMSNLKRQILDLLTEFKHESSNLSVEVLDPAVEATNPGIPSIPINSVSEDKMEMQEIYCGISVSSGKKMQLIPVIFGPENLEYDLSISIQKVSRKQPPVLAVWPSISPEYSRLKQALDEQYVVTSDVAAAQILVVLDPSGVSLSNALSIDHFLMSGRRAIFLINPISVERGLRFSAIDSGLDAQLSHYGLSVNHDLVLDVSSADTALPNGAVMPYPLWPKLLKENFAPNHPVTAELDVLVLPWASSLKFTKINSRVQGVTLASTTPKAWVQTEKFNLKPQQQFLPIDLGQHPMVGAISGDIESYFENGVHAQTAFSVIGNSLFLKDAAVSKFPGNLAFFLNLADWLNQDAAALSLRSRRANAFPLRPSTEPEREAAKWLAILTLPALLAALGLFRFFKK